MSIRYYEHPLLRSSVIPDSETAGLIQAGGFESHEFLLMSSHAPDHRLFRHSHARRAAHIVYAVCLRNSQIS